MGYLRHGRFRQECLAYLFGLLSGMAVAVGVWLFVWCATFKG